MYGQHSVGQGAQRPVEVGPAQGDGIQRVYAAENSRMLDGYTHSAITAHRMPRDAPALNFGQRTIMGIDESHQVGGDEILPVAGRNRVRVEAPL